MRALELILGYFQKRLFLRYCLFFVNFRRMIAIVHISGRRRCSRLNYNVEEKVVGGFALLEKTVFPYYPDHACAFAGR